MITAAEQYDGGVFSCKSVISDDEYDRYGIVAGDKVDDGIMKMSRIIEKPGKANAPSNLATVSSYLLGGEFFAYLERAKDDYNGDGEFTLQPIIQQMIDDNHTFYACEIQNGTYYDTGDKLEYLKTVIDFGLNHPDFGNQLAEFLRSRV